MSFDLRRGTPSPSNAEEYIPALRNGSSETVSFFDAMAVELFDQHRRRRLTDAAAVAVEVHLLKRALVVDLQFQADHVAAQRIGVFVGVRRARTPPTMVRVFVVILDPFLVQFFLVSRHSIFGMSVEIVLIVVYDRRRPPARGGRQRMTLCASL